MTFLIGKLCLPYTAGNYSVAVTDANVWYETSTTTAVTVNALPTVTLVNITSPVCDNSPVIALLGNPTGGVYSGTGVSGSDFNPAVSGVGIFTLSYNYTDVNTCSAVATQEVMVSLCTGIKELNESFVSIYPNPANDLIYVTLLDASLINNTIIEIYNSIGKLILTEKVLSEKTSIKINSLANGIYTVKVISGTLQTLSHIIKN